LSVQNSIFVSLPTHLRKRKKAFLFFFVRFKKPYEKRF